MELTKIKGNTYYINAPTNIGVYTFKNKGCLIIDSGINNSAARKIDDVLVQNGLTVRNIINTHNHVDHSGGNALMTSLHTGCTIYASEKEKLFIENGELQNSVLFCASPIKVLDNAVKSPSVNYVLDYGTNKIGDEKIEILPLPGHSIEQVGVITPEKVCFTGDSVFSCEIIEKYSIPVIYDLDKTIKTLEYAKDIDADYFVISHASSVLNRDEFLKTVALNIKNVHKYADEILELLDQPMSREDIVENITVLNDLAQNFKEYHLCFSTISAFLTYFYENSLIDYSIEDGKLYYFKK